MAKRVQLLCTNDTHSKFDPYTVAATGEELGGVMRRVQRIEQLREEFDGPTLVFDAGDHLTGSEFFSFLEGEAELKCLSMMRYAATAVGNHDYDAAGLENFLELASKHCPEVHVLCANVVHASTGVPVVTPRVVLDVGNGIKVGVTAVLGEQAYNDVPVDFRDNQRYVDHVEAAVAQAAALRKSGCHVIVCLSHTGLNRGDAELVATGAFDVVFGGHEHLYTPCAELPQSCGPSKRLGLYSQGMANGTGLAQVRLSVDPAAGGNITSHEGLLEALDGKLPLVPVAQEGVSVVGAALVQMSKVVGEWRDRFTAMAAEVVGHSAINAKYVDGDITMYNESPLHSTILRAVRSGLLEELGIPEPEWGMIAVTNRNAVGGKRELCKGPITLGVLKTTFPFENRQLYAEISGGLILHMIQFNEQKVLNSNFLFLIGITYELQHRETGLFPDATLTVHDVAAGAITTTRPRVRTEDGLVDVIEGAWYPAVLDKYTKENLLARLSSYDGGIRNERIGLGVKECALKFLAKAPFA